MGRDLESACNTQRTSLVNERTDPHRETSMANEAQVTVASGVLAGDEAQAAIALVSYDTGVRVELTDMSVPPGAQTPDSMFRHASTVSSTPAQQNSARSPTD